MCCHPLEELQDCYNLLFALITPAVLIPKCSAVSPTQPSLIYAAVGRYRNMVKIYTKKCTKTQGITIWQQYSWIELLPHFGLWISVRLILYLDLYMLHENFLQKKSLTENHNKSWQSEIKEKIGRQCMALRHNCLSSSKISHKFWSQIKLGLFIPSSLMNHIFHIYQTVLYQAYACKVFY